MIVTDEDDLRNAEQARNRHLKIAANTFGAERKRHERLADEQWTRVLAIKSRIAKRDAAQNQPR
jgi:hypothetical protein